jgi:hypothetical protein
MQKPVRNQNRIIRTKFNIRPDQARFLNKKGEGRHAIVRRLIDLYIKQEKKLDEAINAKV